MTYSQSLLDRLNDAIEKENLEDIKFLLRDEISLNKFNGSGLTLLHVAAACEADEFVKVLVGEGAGIHERSEFGEWTPLHFAVSAAIEREIEASGYLGGEKTNVVEMLLDLGADPNIQDEQGITPLELAIGYGSKRIFDFIVEFLKLNAKHLNINIFLLNENLSHQKDAELEGRLSLQDKLSRAIIFGDEQGDKFKAIEILLSQGASLNKVDSYGHTPLIVASLCKVGEILKLFVSSSADIDGKSLSGCTSLHFAVEMAKDHKLNDFENMTIVKEILDLGADINAVNNQGVTPFDLAKEYGLKKTCVYMKYFRSGN